MQVPTLDTHKIGVLYVGPGQSTGAAILANSHGSRRYINFLNALGDIVRLQVAFAFSHRGREEREIRAAFNRSRIHTLS